MATGAPGGPGTGPRCRVGCLDRRPGVDGVDRDLHATRGGGIIKKRQVSSSRSHGFLFVLFDFVFRQSSRPVGARNLLRGFATLQTTHICASQYFERTTLGPHVSPSGPALRGDRRGGTEHPATGRSEGRRRRVGSADFGCRPQRSRSAISSATAATESSSGSTASTCWPLTNSGSDAPA